MKAASLLAEFLPAVEQAGCPLFIVEDLVGDQLCYPPCATPQGELNPMINSIGIVCTGTAMSSETLEPVGRCQIACVVDRSGEADWLMIGFDGAPRTDGTPLGGRILEVLRRSMGLPNV